MACIPYPVTAHCRPIQWMSRCNAICARLLLDLLDYLEAAHIGLQDVRHGNRAALLLIGFHDGDQRAADRGAGTVQRMHETRLAVGPAVARIHAPRLKVAAYRAA